MYFSSSKSRVSRDLGLGVLKSVNLQYITLDCLDYGTNESSTKSLMLQVLSFLYFLYT